MSRLHLALPLAAALALLACGGPGGGGPVTLDCVNNPTSPLCAAGNDTGGGDGTVTPTDTGGPGPDTAGPGPDTAGCTPQCTGKACGPNGCGGFCGNCGAGTTCLEGACVAGECGAGGVTVTGTFKVGAGITFDKATIAVQHKMDVDAFEDGCMVSVIMDLGKGFGCTLHVEAGGATAPGGGLRITTMSFAADSQCPGFPDESEGNYVDFSQLSLRVVIPGLDKVPDANAPNSCLTTNFEVQLAGTLSDGAGKTLNVAATSLLVGGEVNSVGSTTASCPCASQCGGKQCGDDGCGFTCGLCAANEQCEAGTGQCLCIPDCDGKECGDDGCGGSCAACTEFQSCVDFVCIDCTPQCSGKDCGDDGCGGSCGTCGSGETCGAAGVCECPGVSCGAACCAGSETCFGGTCCAPSCAGKQCGSDGCGGTCGTCSTGTCNASGQCACVPQCTGKACGADGCGGQCGSCGGNQTCNASGQCIDNTTGCTYTGYTTVQEVATDEGVRVSYLGLDAPYQGSSSINLLEVQFWQTDPGTGPVWGFTPPQAFDVAGANFSNCVVCVLMRFACTPELDCAGAPQFFMKSGTFVLSQFGPAPGTLEFHLTDVVLEEVTIDPTTAVSTPVPGGETWCIPGPLQFGPTAVVLP